MFASLDKIYVLALTQKGKEEEEVEDNEKCYFGI
jgi:hypothetical protein